MSTSDVIVVGGGLVGTAVAYGLAQAGTNVTVLDEGVNVSVVQAAAPVASSASPPSVLKFVPASRPVGVSAVTLQYGSHGSFTPPAAQPACEPKANVCEPVLDDSLTVTRSATQAPQVPFEQVRMPIEQVR